VELDPWQGHRIPHGELRRIAHSIRACRRVELHLAHQPPFTVEPLGLVLKAGSWYLVVAERGSGQAVRLDDLRATRLTTQRFEPPAGFSLGEFWATHLQTQRNG
jgi:WYL domain